MLPILKQPGLMPPTVAGPMMVTPCFLACRLTFFVLNSGIPSAMMAIVRNCGYFRVSRVASSAERKEAKFIKTSASG